MDICFALQDFPSAAGGNQARSAPHHFRHQVRYTAPYATRRAEEQHLRMRPHQLTPSTHLLHPTRRSDGKQLSRSSPPPDMPLNPDRSKRNLLRQERLLDQGVALRALSPRHRGMGAQHRQGKLCSSEDIETGGHARQAQR